MKRLFTTQQRYALAAAVFLSLFVCIVLLKKPIQVSNPHSHFPTKRSDVVAKDSREQSKMIARPQNIRTTTQPQSSARIVRQTRPNTKAASHNRFQNPNSAKSQSGDGPKEQLAKRQFTQSATKLQGDKPMVADPMIVLDSPVVSDHLRNNLTTRIPVNENDFVASGTNRAGVHANHTSPELVNTVDSDDSAFEPFEADNTATASRTIQDKDIEPATLTLAQPSLAQGPSASTQGTTQFRLADAPKIGDRYKSETPIFDNCAVQTETILDDFSPDPIDHNMPYDPYLNQQVYQGKQLNATQRPLLELGQPWYQLGQIAPGSTFLGKHNAINPQFLIFGDYRQAIASNTVNGDNVSQVAYELNTFWSLFLTGTERLVTGVTPFDNGAQNTRWLLDDDRFEFEGDFDFDFGYLEGDLGAITGGLVGETLPFDLPFAAGLTPIFIQNGIWINDALEGVFMTIPARNSPTFNISNMDLTFAYIYDQIDSAAFEGDNSAAKAYAFFLFIEALNGYFEIDYAFLEDRATRDRSYHNIGLAFTRRFGRFISHSTRVIVNTGQQVAFGDQTADGVLFLSENSLITRNPYTVVPYFNFFAGFDTPQSFAGDQELVNTGILFESDGMTGYPTLDGRAQDTFGYAVGLNLIAQDFSQQLILETAAVFRNDDSDLAGDQYGVGMRYQLPLTNSWILRTDGMFGFLRNDSDDFGARVELRKKF